MSPVSESMDRFIVGATRNQIEGVSQIVGRFLTEMDRSLGNQFSSLAQSMSALEQGQIRAAQRTGENLTAAEGIIRNAQSLQDITTHTLDKFDDYMSNINTVQERDEGFEKRAAELLNQMSQESKDMSSLIAGLTDKIENLGDQPDSTADKSLAEIRDLLTSLRDEVTEISDTLTALSEED